MDKESLVGKLAYKKNSGLYGGLAGIVEENTSNVGVSPYVLVLADGTRLGAFPKELVAIEESACRTTRWVRRLSNSGVKTIPNKGHIKIEFVAGCSIDEAVESLLSFKRKGVLAKGEFNGVELCSETISIENAYKNITGMRKDEFEKHKVDTIKRYEELADNSEYVIEYWKERGRKELSEDKLEHWEDIVPSCANGIYKGNDLRQSLELVKMLNENKSLEEVKEKMLKQGHSGMSFSLVRQIVENISDRGKEFSDYVE